MVDNEDSRGVKANVGSEKGSYGCLSRVVGIRLSWKAVSRLPAAVLRAPQMQLYDWLFASKE